MWTYEMCIIGSYKSFNGIVDTNKDVLKMTAALLKPSAFFQDTLLYIWTSI